MNVWLKPCARDSECVGVLQGGRCLELWFHTHGATVGALRVYTTDDLNSLQRWNQIFQTPSNTHKLFS